jgi:hypothetical protein
VQWRGRAPAATVWLACGLGVCLGLGLFPAQATTFGLGDAEVKVSGAVSAGTSVRTQSANPAFITRANGAAAGVPGIAPAGRNQDDGNLNYLRGDPVSTVLKALVNVEAKYNGYGAHLRAIAWRDFTLADGGVPWGNIPNNYAVGAPLGESSNSVYGRYSGVALLDANVYGNGRVGDMPLYGKLGWQLLPWGVSALIGGGLNVLNPVNQPALRRPGVLSEEIGIPFPAVFVRLGLTSTTNIEAFYQFAFQRTEPLGCGTFFSTLDYLADRCDKVVFGAGLTDSASLAQLNYAKRAPDRDPSDLGQFGIGITHTVEPIATQFGAYFAQYHLRSGIAGVVKSRRPASAGEAYIAGDPDGLNPQYFIQYPEDIRVFAVNMTTRRPDLTLFAEITHRLNQPMQLNSTDITNAANSNTAPTFVRAEYAAIPLGGIYDAYDRFQTTDVQFGATRTFGTILGAKILGAKSATLGAEAGFKYVHSLPDPNVRRYGRSDVFGSAPFNGTCTVVGPGLTCSNDGFVTPLASGMRARGSLSYPDVFSNVTVTPSVTYGWDVSGWSYDAAFNEGRQFAIISLRAEYQKQYAAEIAYQPIWGGRYNNARDRDVLTMAVSARF